MRYELLALVVMVMSLVITPSPATAGGNNIDLSFFPRQQSQFDTLVEELGTAVAYNPISPAETLGLTGFELGISVSVVDIDESIWNNAVSDAAAPSQLPVPRLMARKGLPFAIDLGFTYTRVPGSNISIVGGELRKALIEGSISSPAVAVLGHFTKLNGVGDLDLSAYGADLGISKGFAMLTPYAAAGLVRINGSENAGLGLEDQNVTKLRAYLGTRIALGPVFNLVVQADFSNVNSYDARLNLGF